MRRDPDERLHLDPITSSDNPPHRRDFLRGAAALAASASLALSVATQPTTARAQAPNTGKRISYYRDGAIHVAEVGQPDGTPLTTGHWDFKPSWSKTGDTLVFFRRYRDDPVTVNWLSAICIINVDGTGFHQLTDATLANFNPTWTRDGTNTPIWNRKNPDTGGFYVMQGQIGGRPGEEIALTDRTYHTWAFSTLNDGRILVNSLHPTLGWGYFLMSPSAAGTPAFEPIACDLARQGLLDRVSVAPSETKVCFEFQKGFVYKDPGRTLFMADFDPGARTITNPRPVANEDGTPAWYAYPRWIEGEDAIVYHRSAGKGQLFVYRLQDGSTTRISTDPGADYRYPHGEAAPC